MLNMFHILFIYFFLASGVCLPTLPPDITVYVHSDSACRQSFSTLRDAGFDPGTSASVVWSAIP